MSGSMKEKEKHTKIYMVWSDSLRYDKKTLDDYILILNICVTINSMYNLYTKEYLTNISLIID